MKTLRLYGTLCLTFVLWELLFPPWSVSFSAAKEIYGSSDVREWRGSSSFLPTDSGHYSYGHHWRFSAPFYWVWDSGSQQNLRVLDYGARIDYLTMAYQIALFAVSAAIFFSVLPVLPQAVRYSVAAARRLRNHLTPERMRTANKWARIYLKYLLTFALWEAAFPAWTYPPTGGDTIPPPPPGFTIVWSTPPGHHWFNIPRTGGIAVNYSQMVLELLFFMAALPVVIFWLWTLKRTLVRVIVALKVELAVMRTWFRSFLSRIRFARTRP